MWIECFAEFPARQWKQRTFFTHERTYEQLFLVTMSTSTNEHRYKNKTARPTTSASMEEDIAQNQQFYSQNSPRSYLHRQFNDRYITSFIINVYFRDIFFKVELPFNCYRLSPASPAFLA